MRNVTLTEENGELVIRCRMDAGAKASASGKSLVIASTEGNADVPGRPGEKIGLNYYRSR